jgi:hypothetical protein
MDPKSTHFLVQYITNQKELLLQTPSDFDEFWLWFQTCNDYVSFSLGPPFKQLKIIIIIY